MLDPLSDADSELEPTRTARSGNVEESIHHLTHEDLQAYVAGRLASARLQHCRTHLDSCEACRAELEDLRTYNGELSGLPRSEPQRREPDRRKRRRGLGLPVAASITLVFVVAIAAFLWWGHGRPRVSNTSVASTVTHSVAATFTHSSVSAASSASSVAPPPAANTTTRDSRLTDEIAALPEDVRPAISEAIQHGKLQLPTDLSLFRERAATQANTGFALLGPFGEAISETRPEFRWQPVAGAIRYSVTIVDARLHPVQHSPALHTTSWRPRRPLRRGQTYLWQVTATLRGRSTVVASSPPPPGALLRIVPLKLADEMAKFRRGHEAAHLVLGALYAQAGMLTESADELKRVPPGDSTYGTAKTLLESLPPTGPAGAPQR